MLIVGTVHRPFRHFPVLQMVKVVEDLHKEWLLLLALGCKETFEQDRYCTTDTTRAQCWLAGRKVYIGGTRDQIAADEERDELQWDCQTK